MLPVYLIPGITDQLEYIKMLEEVMLPYAEEEILLKWVLKPDKDPEHTNKPGASWFQTKKINAMA